MTSDTLVPNVYSTRRGWTFSRYYTDPSHFELKVWWFSVAWFWNYTYVQPTKFQVWTKLCFDVHTVCDVFLLCTSISKIFAVLGSFVIPLLQAHSLPLEHQGNVVQGYRVHTGQYILSYCGIATQKHTL